ncbi:hypothetical protein GCM10010306_090560 [Streptomyces umbrinus]|uniref:hypothetical protein n=1 Tax=Streptomyces umbrinus TaxID=67370 RepID=UPI0016760D58|nr:hypothetical protein [Streptomyces umbrinus]GHB81997.1 hypothetical protein GCM10010306_090560 [Streptomyces umbrinus]
MSVAMPIPPALLGWAQSVVGPVYLPRDVSRDRDNSLVWRLSCATRAVFAKVAPSPKAFARDTRALREVAPGMEPGEAPLLLGADPLQLALLLSPASGRMVKALSLTPSEQRTLHRQAGRWLRRFHGGAGELSPQDRADAADEVARAAAGGEEHLGRAVEALYEPLKMNYLLLGNQIPHAHWPCAPRRQAGTDPAPGGPLPFMALDPGRQDKEQLQADAQALRQLMNPAGRSGVPR